MMITTKKRTKIITKTKLTTKTITKMTKWKFFFFFLFYIFLVMVLLCAHLEYGWSPVCGTFTNLVVI